VGDTQLWALKLVRDVLILATGLTVLGALEEISGIGPETVEEIEPFATV
jgi:hypothetical protein